MNSIEYDLSASDKDRPHRKYMSSMKSYVDLQDIAIPMIQDGFPSYDSVVLHIREDPLVVCIENKCRMCPLEANIFVKMLEICCNFPDPSRIFNVDGNYYVYLIDLYCEYSKEFRELGIQNQFELRAMLSFCNVVTNFDSVKLSSIRDRFKLIESDSQFCSEFDSDTTKKIDKYTKDELSSLILDYLAQFPSERLPQERILKNLNVSESDLQDSLVLLSSKYLVSVSKDGVKLSNNTSKEKVERISTESKTIDTLTNELVIYLEKYPNQSVRFDRICSELSITPEILEKIVNLIRKKKEFIILPDSIVYEGPSAKAGKKTQLDTKIVEKECPKNSISEKHTIESDKKETKISIDQAVKSIKEHLSKNEGIQFSTYALGRFLNIPEYMINDALDKLEKTPGYSVTAYGIMKNKAKSKDGAEIIVTKSNNKENVRPIGSKPDPIRPISEMVDFVVTKSNDRKFIMSLFEGSMDYMPLSKLIGAYYRNNSSSQITVSDIRSILESSPYVVSYQNTYRAVPCSEEDFKKVMDGNFRFSDKNEFSLYFSANHQKFESLGYKNYEEAYQRYVISKPEDSLSSVETDKIVPVKIQKKDHPPIVLSGTKGKIMDALSDGRKCSPNLVSFYLKNNYGIYIDQSDVKKILDELHDEFLLFKSSGNMYRSAGRPDIKTETEKILSRFTNCIYDVRTLYLNNKNEFSSIGINDASELMDVISRFDRVETINKTLISLDGCKPEDMIYSEKYSKELLENHFGLPSNWIKMRRY